MVSFSGQRKCVLVATSRVVGGDERCTQSQPHPSSEEKEGWKKRAFVCLGNVAIDDVVRTDLIKAKLESDRDGEMKGKRCKKSSKEFHLLFTQSSSCCCFVAAWCSPIHRQTHKFDDLFPAGFTKAMAKSEER
jgi:hypothetical protein